MYRGELGQSISKRAGLATEFAKNMARQQAQDDVLRTKLIEAAPEELREWLKEDGVLRCLFEFGKYSGKIKFNGYYGFGTLVDIKKKMILLSTTWKDVVLVELDKHSEPHRVGVTLSAII